MIGSSFPSVDWAVLGFLTMAGLQAAPQGLAPSELRTWRVYGGDPWSTQSSSLDQINRHNVHRLELAWIYHAGDKRGNGRSQIQCNPIVINRTLYATSPQLKALALDAATGREVWRFDPFSFGARRSALGVNRGVVYWKRGDDQRILFTAGQRLFALDAVKGTPIPTFGHQGWVDLREGLGRDARKLYVLSNTPGVVYGDILILGTRVSEGPGPSAPGHIRAYDVRTGRLRWTFHTIPQPGEFGYETWPPDAWKTIGGANAWSGLALDRTRGWVFCPTGSPAFDFWGGNRRGQNLFGDCLLVLDAATGKRIWHFQFVHHDLWDRDLPATPNLVTVQRKGRQIDAVAQITKSGHIFMFDRETGSPLFPIDEIPVPPSDLKDEAAWPTQPRPQRPFPFARQALTEALLTDLSPESHEAVAARLRQVRTGSPFIPPSLTGSVIFPGFDGGGEWGGASWDPDTEILYVNSNEMPWILTMVDIGHGAKDQSLSRGETVYRRNCAACHGLDREGDPVRTFPPLIGIEKRMDRRAIHILLDSGKGNMPSFGFLSRREKRWVAGFLIGKEEADDSVRDRGPRSRRGQKLDVPYTHTGYNRFLDPDGYPAVKPPWGTLNAIDLSRGELLWQVALGEVPELTQRGIPVTGTENYGGSIVTKGGLVFIGASKDERFRAFDKATGEILWETQLPAGGYATPCTYELDGRQFVVIACGGGKMGTKSGDAYVAFALPPK